MLGFAAVGGRIRTIVILLSLVSPGGCAADSIVLPPAPAATDSGVVPFQSAGCLKKGVTAGPDPLAAEQARKNLRAQLDELMK